MGSALPCFAADAGQNALINGGKLRWVPWQLLPASGPCSPASLVGLGLSPEPVHCWKPATTVLPVMQDLASAAAQFTNQPRQLAAFRAVDQLLTSQQRNEFWVTFNGTNPPATEVPVADQGGWLAQCLKIVQEFEGCRLAAYPDPASGGEPWTIGWGTTTYSNGQRVKQGDRITQTQADSLLITRLTGDWQVQAKRIPTWGRMTQNQRAALVSFSYNCGAAWFGSEGFNTLTSVVRAADWPAVPKALMLYVNPGSSVEAGLRRRRRAEGALFAGQASAPAVAGRMVGPGKRPDLKPGDHHLIANDVNQTITAYTHDGVKVWQVPCLCRGQGGESEWNTTGSDTPPGLYLVGKVYRDYDDDPSKRFSEERRSYGWYSLDLMGQEGQEGPGSRNGRDGIMIHGGGTACGWPGAWAPRQELHPTLGCIRMHNQDIRDRVLPLLLTGRIWVSVYQEAPPA